MDLYEAPIQSRRGVDGTIAALAERQHGVVARRQLLQLGIGPGAVAIRLERGRLHRLHPAVYAVGHTRLTVEGRWMAAVLAGDAGAVLSHRDAGASWEIRPARHRLVDITVPPPYHPRPDVSVHRASLAPDEVTVRDGIPVTTVARTLLDLAAAVPHWQVERAFREAEARLLVDASELTELVRRNRGRRGIRTIRRLLAVVDPGQTITRSEMEARFLAFLDRRGLPRPRTNVPIHLPTGRIEVDCLWPRARLVVELDSRAWHSSPTAFERDRARDRALTIAGYRPIRITWRQLRDEPERVAFDLRRLIGAEIGSMHHIDR